MYYLQNLNAGYVGNSPFLWRKGGGGYTLDVDNAQLFSRDEARKIIRGSRGSHKWRMLSERRVRKAIYRTVDAQLL